MPNKDHQVQLRIPRLAPHPIFYLQHIVGWLNPGQGQKGILLRVSSDRKMKERGMWQRNKERDSVWTEKRRELERRAGARGSVGGREVDLSGGSSSWSAPSDRLQLWM